MEETASDDTSEGVACAGIVGWQEGTGDFPVPITIAVVGIDGRQVRVVDDGDAGDDDDSGTFS